ncbi:MAG TPA: hypothetical protein PK649_05730, partial [Vicingus sp.]|nr:hypothetical protein [Vicingus sp.]
MLLKIKIYTTVMESPLGRITLGSTNKGLCLLEFDDEKRINNHFSQFKKFIYRVFFLFG